MKRLIFTLTGISLLDQKKGLLGKGRAYDTNLGQIRGAANINAIIQNNRILNEYKTQVLKELAGGSLRDNLPKFSVEIASLYRLQALDNKADKVILMVSETPECAFSGIVNGKFIVYRRTNNQNWDSIIFNESNDVFTCDNVEIKPIEGLQVADRKKFVSQGIKNLFAFVSNKIEEEAPCHGEIIFNITGGYKGTIPYLTIFGMLYQERELNGKRIKPLIKYLYEESEDIITLPNLPIAFDLPTWRDYRGLIKTIPLLEKKQAEIILQKVLPPQISELFEAQPSKYKLNPFGEELKNRYQKEKVSLTPFGRGYLLLDKIKNESLRVYLKGCINQWQHLWIGNKIPEMVEHERGHTQRVLELAAELLYSIVEESFLSDAELASLVGAIWLHDLGQSGEKFKLDRKPYLLRGFPSLIWDFHNLCTATILEEENDKLFPSTVLTREGEEIRKDSIPTINGVIENIRTISKYHRKWTPLTKDRIDSNGLHCIHLSEAIWDDNLRFFTALYRILDACDTQIERTVDDAYIDTRKMTVNREVKILIEEKKALENNRKISDFITDFHKIECKECININLDLLKGSLNWIFKEDKNTERKTVGYADCLNCVVGKAVTCDNLNISGAVKKWLSCLDQIFFKKRQPLHYEKHKGIDAVMILFHEKEGKLFKFNVLMVGARNTSEDKLREVIEKDIISEYKQVKSILDSQIKFRFSYQCYGQASQIYKDYNDFEDAVSGGCKKEFCGVARHSRFSKNGDERLPEAN